MKFPANSPLYRFVFKFGNIIIVNLCFVVFCIPIITIGPALTAMYRCFLTMADGADAGLVSVFWNSFRLNFKKSLLLELCTFPVLAITAAEAIFYLAGLAGRGVGRAIAYFLPLILVSCVASYIFPLQAQFENSLAGTLKNAGILAAVHFPATIVMTVTNLILPVILYFRTDFFLKYMVAWMFFGFALPAYFNTGLLKKIFEQYFPKREDSTEDRENQNE